MKQLYLVLISLFLLAAVARAEEPIPTLDLTKPLRCEDQLAKITSISGVVAGPVALTDAPPPPRLPLDLRLVAIEPLPLRAGNKVTYEVELENVGTAPIQIPWGTECDVMRRDDANEVTAGVSLILDEYPESSSFVSDWAYGTTDDPRTTHTLAPGGKARIRLDDTVYFLDYPNELKTRLKYQTRAIIDVRAELSLDGKPYRKYGGYILRKSLNIVPMEVTRRPAP